MGLINCPDCGANVSDSAITCPKCNSNIRAYVNSVVDEAEKRAKRKGCFYLVVIAIIVIVLISIFGGESDSNSNAENNINTESEMNIQDYSKDKENYNKNNSQNKESEKSIEVNNVQKEFSDFLPNGYVVFDKIYGDLNKDGKSDCVLLIKGTNKDNFVKNQFDEIVDRNRRGIIILFKKNDHYEVAIKNYDCFASENEDGGVYYPPEMSIKCSKGNLYVHYSHGRYGHWKYTFKNRNSDFELIGYDESNGGIVIDSELSINFLTKKKQKKVNTNENAEGGDEVFTETWENIKVDRLVKLSEIKDFSEPFISVY